MCLATTGVSVAGGTLAADASLAVAPSPMPRAATALSNQVLMILSLFRTSLPLFLTMGRHAPGGLRAGQDCFAFTPARGPV
jgi:hypothetical protein